MPRLVRPPFRFGGRDFAPEEVVERLAPFVGEERQARIAEVVAARTVAVVPVLERAHDLGNVNAVLRSAEGLGVGAAHLVGLQGEAADWLARRELDATGPGGGRLTGRLGRARRQSQGADKWLDLHVWPTPADALAALRARGYAVVATHLSAAAVPIGAWDFSRPTALVLGAEAHGVSAATLAAADANVVIPVSGFAQSFNVSVAAALALYHAREDRLRRLGHHGDLSEDERQTLAARYALRSVRRAEAVLARQLEAQQA